MKQDKKHPISLVMDDGTIPPTKGEGVVYKFRSGNTDQREYYLWEVEGYNNEAFYTFSEYPMSDVMDDIKNIYAGEEWFEPDDMDEILENGYDVNRVSIFVENNYKLPYQEVYLENGRVFAHDEESDKDRELVRIRIAARGMDGIDEEASFYIFTRNAVWNKPMIMNLLAGMDSKVPHNFRMKCDKIWQNIMETDDYAFEVEDVYVLSTV